MNMVNTRLFVARLESRPNGYMAKILGIGTLLPFISILFPLLMDCFKPADGSELKRFLVRRFDEKKESFPKRDLDRMAMRVKQAMEEDGGLLEHETARKMGEELMLTAKESDETHLSLVINEHRRAA